MPEGKYWPTEEDRMPQSTRFWVAMNSPDAVSPIIVTETPAQINDRLMHNFLLYKVAKVLGFSAAGRNELDNEV